MMTGRWVAVRWLDGSSGLLDSKTCSSPFQAPGNLATRLFPLSDGRYVLDVGTGPYQEIASARSAILLLTWGYRLPPSLTRQIEAAQEDSTARRVQLPLTSPAFQGPAVILTSPAEPPIVLGEPQELLTFPQFNVVVALNEAGPIGLGKNALVRKSGHGDARKILNRVRRKGINWSSVIQMPGKAHGRYRIGVPA